MRAAHINNDWSTFVNLAKLTPEVNTSRDYKNRVCSVRLNGISIVYDFYNRRVHYSRFNEDAKRVYGPEWLDNDIFIWLDTLRGIDNEN